MSQMGKNILVIAAHPDDEVLGCGATMAKLAAAGHEVRVLILGEGISARDENRDREKREKEIQVLKANMAKANNILGTGGIFTFDLPDNRFDTVPLLDVIKLIEKVKKDVSPEVIFTHHHADLNIDHCITFKAVMTAFRPLRGESVREIYSFEVLSSTEWNAPLAGTYFRPNYFVDISETLAQKLAALREYESEIREFPHPRSPEAIRLNARRWGGQVGLEAAEAFEVIRMIS